MVAETPASDNLRMSAETPELVICVDAQIPNRGADFFLRMVAETPALDVLRILYVTASFSRSISMNSAFIRRNSRTDHARRSANT